MPTPFNTGVIKDGHITNDSLVGSTGPDLLRGLGGDDTLAGGGGADQLLGGAGDDALHIPDLSFASAVGGAGSDRLVVDGAALTPSLAALLPGRLQGIEAIDLGASANNRLVLSRQNLLDLSDSDVLTVDGGYAVFTNGAATLRVASGITVDTTLAIAATSAVRAEGNSGATPFTFTVTRAGGVAGVNTVRWSVIGGTAPSAAPTDFVGGVAPSGTLTFAAGETSKLVMVNVQGDATAEPDENFRVVLQAPSGGASVTGNTAYDTILTDDSNLAISANTPNLAESKTGSTPFVFAVTRTGATGGTTTVHWSTIGVASDSANPADFTGATITSANATIANDDVNFAIAATAASKAEGNAGTTSFTITVTRGGVVGDGGFVAWPVIGLAPNSAGPSDFAGGIVPSGTLSFAADETSKVITVDVACDTVVEATENFRVVLGGANAGASVTVGSANGRILDDETTLAIAATDAVKPEGNSGTTASTFTVTRGGNNSGTDTAHWQVVGLAPNPAGLSDLAGGVAASGDVTFLPAVLTQAITVNVQGDTNAEPDEHFRVLLQAPSAGVRITTNNASATVLNDDPGPALPASLTEVARADFTGDGTADLLRKAPSGALFLLDGADAVMSALSRSAAGMGFAGAGDLDGDGCSDIVLRDAAGGLHDWAMNGAAVRRDDLITTLSASVSVLRVADISGEGRADLVLHDSAAGAASPYAPLTMDGARIVARSDAASLPDAWRS